MAFISEMNSSDGLIASDIPRKRGKTYVDRTILPNRIHISSLMTSCLRSYSIDAWQNFLEELRGQNVLQQGSGTSKDEFQS